MRGGLGCLHLFGVGSVVLLLIAVAVGSEGLAVIAAVPALVLSLYVIDFAVAIGHRLGLTERSGILGSNSEQRSAADRIGRRSQLGFVVSAYFGLLRRTERTNYGRDLALGRLSLLVAGPLAFLGAIGVVVGLDGYNGSALIVIGFGFAILAAAIAWLLYERGGQP